MRITLQYRNIAVTLALVGSLMISNAEMVYEDPPKELLEYVSEAKRRGVRESKIREDALSAGWPSDTVEKAISQGAGTAAASRAIPTAVTAGTVKPAEGPLTRLVSDEYQIGAGDTLHVSVWKEAEVSLPSVVVRPDGKITVPLIKDVDVAGMTPGQAEKVIADKLSRFIIGADVTVVVTAINSKKVYVLGAVKKEGTLPYTYRMTVMQALSEAGGFTEYAKRSRVYVLRNENGKEYRLPFNYDDVIKGERPEQNIELLPGDQLVIPR